MSTKTKKHVMRGCCRNGCSNYAVAVCDSWDKDTGAVCERPVCNSHRVQVGTMDFCPKHHPPGHATTQMTLLQPSLGFDSAAEQLLAESAIDR